MHLFLHNKDIKIIGEESEVFYDVSWMANKASADDAVEKHNANDLKDVKKCKECREYFWQTDEERTWFADRNMKAPCRCYSCRKKKH